MWDVSLASEGGLSNIWGGGGGGGGAEDNFRSRLLMHQEELYWPNLTPLASGQIHEGNKVRGLMEEK